MIFGDDDDDDGDNDFTIILEVIVITSTKLVVAEEGGGDRVIDTVFKLLLFLLWHRFSIVILAMTVIVANIASVTAIVFIALINLWHWL